MTDRYWERVNGTTDTYRLEVPGGWIYRCDPAMVFVPKTKGDFDHEAAIKLLHEAEDLYSDGEPAYAYKRINTVIEMLDEYKKL